MNPMNRAKLNIGTMKAGKGSGMNAFLGEKMTPRMQEVAIDPALLMKQYSGSSYPQFSNSQQISDLSENQIRFGNEYSKFLEDDGEIPQFGTKTVSEIVTEPPAIVKQKISSMSKNLEKQGLINHDDGEADLEDEELEDDDLEDD